MAEDATRPAWVMGCIGHGPGPKNVLAVHVDGRQMCVPYAVWKHRLSKETHVSDEKVYVTAIGVVQKFGKDKPVVSNRELGGVTVHSFTIQTSNQGYLGVNVWPEIDHSLEVIVEGQLVGIRGEYSESTGNNGQTYKNVKALSISGGGKTFQKRAREVVNQQAPAAAETTEAAPAAAAAAQYTF